MSGEYECGVCWWVYDPRAGDEHQQILAGTPFAALPATWTCPRCDSDRLLFLPLTGERPGTAPRAIETTSGNNGGESVLQRHRDDRLRALVDDYREVMTSKMAGLPIINAHLEVAAVGFAAHRAGQLGAIITPWLLSAVWLPDRRQTSSPDGGSACWDLPSGLYDAAFVRLRRVGTFECLSLLSPVEMLSDMAVARDAARAALAELLAPSETSEREPRPVSRRRLFTGLAGGE